MELKDIVEKIDSLKRELETLKPIKPELENKIWHKLRLDWNYHSNHIEGNSLTFGETKVLLETGHVVGTITKPKRDYDEIIGHDKAIDIIKQLAENKTPLTEATIRELHKTILPTDYMLDAQTPDGKPTKRHILIGEYKKHPNHVLTSKGDMFYFAAPEETKPKMSELIDSFRNRTINNSSELLLLISEFHYKFVLIHPFDDGNGRLARLLLNYFLIYNSYPPIIIKTEDKKNYFTALEASDAGNIESLLIYLAEQLNKSFDLIVKAAKGENIEEEDDIDKSIKLLNKKIEYLGKNEIREEKSADSIDKIFQKNILPLLTAVFNKLSKFDGYFKSTDLFYLINNSGNTQQKENFLETLFHKIMHYEPQNLQNFAVRYNFNGFKKAGVNDFNVSQYLHFVFEKYKYQMHYNHNILIDNLYDQFLNSEQIELVSNEIANNTLTSIEKNIDKIINNQN